MRMATKAQRHEDKDSPQTRTEDGPSRRTRRIHSPRMKPAASGGAINTDDGGGICAERRFHSTNHRGHGDTEERSGICAERRFGDALTADSHRRRTVAENAEMDTDEH